MVRTGVLGLTCAALIASVSCTSTSLRADIAPEPVVMRWDHRPEAAVWTRTAMAALRTHGAELPVTVPEDIERYCPGYPDATAEERRQFWTGLISALAEYESTWRPEASGGGGRWLGLLQIAPATARSYGCEADSASDLKNGAANLACGIRIMSETVPRDGVIATHDSRWRGIAADWAPFQATSKRADMAAWTREQPYCQS